MGHPAGDVRVEKKAEHTLQLLLLAGESPGERMLGASGAAAVSLFLLPGFSRRFGGEEGKWSELEC